MKTHCLTSLSRRALLVGFITAPTLTWAHSGHGPTRMSAEVRVGRVKDGAVKLVLTLVNTASTPTALLSITAKGAAPVVLPQPFEVAGFGTGELEITLDFQGEVPGRFTATLDFGDHGHRSVTVTL